MAAKKKTPTKPKKTRKSAAKSAPEAVLKVRGMILLKLRAAMAEYQECLAKYSLARERAHLEQSKPQYANLMALLLSKEATHQAVGDKGKDLRLAQEAVCKKLKLPYNEFIEDYTIDTDTGAVMFTPPTPTKK